MGHTAGLYDLERGKSLASAGIRTPDRPARSLVAVPNTPCFTALSTVHKQPARGRHGRAETRRTLLSNCTVDCVALKAAI